jgi:hypothetical protein
LPQDYPGIVLSIAESINPDINISVNDQKMIDAAERFSLAGAAPREIRESIIASQAVLDGEIGVEHIEFASFDIIPNSNRIASVFSDYVALSYCRNNSFLPWWNDSTNNPDPNYPYPDYIREILNDDFSINQEKLSKRIAELEPYANV